jgi:hypothetical protein
MRKLLVVLSIMGAIITQPYLTAAFEEVGDRPSGHLDVEVWLNKHNGSVYKPGQYVRIYFQAPEDCYVAVYNVDTDGFINVLYPKYNDQAWVEGGRIYEIPDPYDDYDLIVDGRKGIEYVVAVASHFPLNLRALYELEAGVDYDIYWPGGHITGDPHLAIQEINQQLAWGDEEYEPEGYASDVSWFYVQQWVPYPRYIVYQWYPDYYWDPWWDPYVHVHIWTDFYWDHYWCRSWWWCHGCQPIYVYWYIDRDTGRRSTWKGYYHRDRRKPDWYREKPVRRGGGDRPSRPKDERDDIAWEERRRPSRSGPGQSNETIRERPTREEVYSPSRPSRQDRTESSRGQSDRELKSREESSRRAREETIKKRTRTEIRRSTERQKSQERQPAQVKSSTKSETKKMEKSSGRSSGVGKIIGGVAKFFTGGGQKKESKSQSKTEKSSSTKQSSRQESSKESSETERKSR